MIPSLLSPARHRAAALASISGVIATCGFIAACGSTAPPAQAPASGLGSTTSAPASTASTTTPPSDTGAASTAATATGPAGCLASGLQAQLGGSQGAAGTIYQVIDLTNTSASNCTLDGYPGVSFVTGVGGREVGAPATKNSAVTPAQITLAPGGKANVLLAVHDAGAFPNCRLTSVNWLRIYPPGDYGSLFVQYKAQTCANRANTILTVTAVGAGAGSAS